ncbi:MAG: prepilin peptidase [Opitutaceae bacterium]
MNPIAPALFGLPPGFTDVIALVVGACVGSFLNVVIRRLPAGASLLRPGSHCECGAPIAWRDNIPILSWFILGRKARCCGRRIPGQYPLVEALTAAAFLACKLRYPPAVALCGWVFLSALIAATFIDLDHLIIPEGLTVGLGLAGIVLSLLVPALHGDRGDGFALDGVRSVAAAVEGLLVGSGLVLWIAAITGSLLKKEAIGMGDVIFVGAIGAFCGWHGAIFAVFGGSLVGVLWIALSIILRTRRRPGLGAQVPFGPMLAIAGAIYFLALRGPIDSWFAQVSPIF